MAACARRGLDVRPFKAGPDFIDPGHHTAAASLGRSGPPPVSHNLDTWMLGPKGAREVYHRHGAGGDVAVVEGVMGLFDGASATAGDGSTAELARALDLPVLLVFDARSMARSAAALVGGFVRFEPGLAVAGVLANRVGSHTHARLLEEALAEYVPEAPLLGALWREEGLALPSRHLGLVTAEDHALDEAALDTLADWFEAGCDLDALLEALPGHELSPPPSTPVPTARVPIAVARDEAFCFYYAENLRILEAAGAEPLFFSPMRDKALPENVGGIYLPGGYPELHAFELSQNTGMKRAVARAAAAGLPVWAECGGLLYLLDGLEGPRGRSFRMAGVFPWRARMEERSQALGYREVEQLTATPLGPAGTVLRGHEFHYSRLEQEPDPEQVRAAFMVRGRTGPTFRPEGWMIGNTLGTYIHMHLGSNPEAAAHFTAACAAALEDARKGPAPGG